MFRMSFIKIDQMASGEIEDMIETVDRNKDGKISYSEFRVIIIVLLLRSSRMVDHLIIIVLLREIAINTVETSFKRLNLGDFSDGATRVYKCKY